MLLFSAWEQKTSVEISSFLMPQNKHVTFWEVFRILRARAGRYGASAGKIWNTDRNYRERYKKGREEYNIHTSSRYSHATCFSMVCLLVKAQDTTWADVLTHFDQATKQQMKDPDMFEKFRKKKSRRHGRVFLSLLLLRNRHQTKRCLFCYIEREGENKQDMGSGYSNFEILSWKS